MSLKNTFVVKEAAEEMTYPNSGGKTVFLVTFGEGRPGGSTETLIGIFSTHEAAMDAGSAANHEAGITGDAEGDSYGAMIDEVELDKLLNYPM